MDETAIANKKNIDLNTRIFVHVQNLVTMGQKNIIITTVDTDVIVIAISCFENLASLGLKELWIAFGSGINKRWIPIHALSNALGTRTKGFLFWYAFIGCDTVSAFGVRGKKTAWEAWNILSEFNSVFTEYSLYKHVRDLSDHDIKLLEKFTCILYERCTVFESVNECLRGLFTKHGRQVESIPLTKDALLLHIKRAIYQAIVWHQATP